MTYDFKKYYNSAGDYPLSERLKFFLDKKEITTDKIIEISEKNCDLGDALQKITRICNGKYDKKYMNDKRILESIDKISDKILDVPIEWLLKDYGKYYRALTLATQHLYGAENNNGYFGRFHLDEIETRTESEIEKNENINLELLNDIKNKFINMKIIDCYKLVKYYEFYVGINEYIWRHLLLHLILLNEKGTKTFKEYISQFQSPNILSFDKRQIEKIHLLIDIRDDSDKYLREELNKEIKKSGTKARYWLWEQLEEKLRNDCIDNKLNFFRRMKEIVTMNHDDLNVLIVFYSNISKDNTMEYSYAQEKIFEYLEKLCLNKEYSNLSVESIKKVSENNYEFEYDDEYDYYFQLS